MNVKDAITLRRSIRKWKEKEIPDEIILELFDAARMAPSAKNVQSHRYYILKNEEIQKLKSKEVFIQSYVYDAPMVIICCADPSQYPEKTDVDEDSNNYAEIDLSIATAFLTLRATELGLGSVYVAWIDRKRIKEHLNIPGHYIIPFVIPIGYPDEEPNQKDKLYLDEILINKVV